MLLLSIFFMTTSSLAAESTPEEVVGTGDCNNAASACSYRVQQFKTRCDALPGAAESALEAITLVDHTCWIMDYASPVCFECDGIPAGGTCVVLCDADDGVTPPAFTSQQDLIRYIGELLGEETDPTDPVPEGAWVQTDFTYGVSQTCPVNLGAPCSSIGSVCYDTLGGAQAVAYEYTCL